MTQFQNKYYLQEISDDIESIINNNGKAKTDEELQEMFRWGFDTGWFDSYPEDLYHKKYSDETIKIMSEINTKLLDVYKSVKALDKMLSGDVEEEDFIKKFII
jgi:hypothetical protein